jgi:hypothetical protein
MKELDKIWKEAIVALSRYISAAEENLSKQNR